MSGFTCPDCPMCGLPPQIQLSDQAFCGNDDCRVFMWIPSRTQAENLADAAELPPLVDAPDATFVRDAIEVIEDRLGDTE